MGTFQKIVNCLKERLNFGADSAFLDIGSGLGKPNLHVAVEPGVKLSFGVELEKLRWQLSMHNLRHCMAKVGGLKKSVQAHKQNTVYFAHADVTDISNFSPFTHVYQFDIGFPPAALIAIANAFNVSRTVQALVSFQRPRHIIGTYGFHVQLVEKITTRMHGSSEGHTAYVYRSLHNTTSSGQKRTKKSEENTPSIDGEVTEPPNKRRRTRSSARNTSPVKQARRQQMQLHKVFKTVDKKEQVAKDKDIQKQSLQGAKLEGNRIARDLFGSLGVSATRKGPGESQADPIFQAGFDLLAPEQSLVYSEWISRSGGLLDDKPRPKRSMAATARTLFP